LVDREYQPGGDDTSSFPFLPEQNKSSQVISSRESQSEHPPSKKARYSEDVSSTHDDGREEGEISDEEDDVIVQTVTPGKSASTSLRHKPPSSHIVDSHSESKLQLSSHRQVPTNRSPKVPEAHRHRHSRDSHVTEKHSHSHHRHRVHSSHSSVKDDSKLAGYQPVVDGVAAHRTERSSSSHKHLSTHVDGRKELARTSSHHHSSSDKAPIVENVKHKEHRGSGTTHRQVSSNESTVSETVRHKSHDSRHLSYLPLQSDLPLSNVSAKDHSVVTNHAHLSLTSELKVETTEKNGLQTVSQYGPPSKDDCIQSQSVLRSSRHQHIPFSSTLGSEIAKNVSRSSAGNNLAKNALQLLSSQHQVTDSVAADQSTPQLDRPQRPLSSSSGMAGTAKVKSHPMSNSSSSGHDSVSGKQHEISQSNVVHESAAKQTTENVSSQRQIQEELGNIDETQLPHVNTAHTPQPAVAPNSSTSSQMSSRQQDMDAPYSPGFLDICDLFETSVTFGLSQSLLNKGNTNSVVSTVSLPCSSVEPNSKISNASIEDSIVEIDTAESAGELAAGEEVEMVAESVAIESRGQEYEIIDDLDSNADEMEDNANAVASSENSEVEYDSGEDVVSPDKHVMSQRNQRTRESLGGSDQIGNNLELFDEDGDNDFQAPTVNHKVVLQGEFKQ